MTRIISKRISSSLFAFALSVSLLAACGDGDHDHDHPDAAAADPDAAAQTDANGDQQVTVNFAALVGGEPFACGTTYDNLGTSASSVYIKDFRLYVSNIRLVDAADNEVPMTLENDGVWQLQTDSDGHVALLDFEDGQADCSTTGNSATRSTVTGTAPAGTYTGVVFDVGVPFALNHLDVATAESPLNITSLYWAWALGHKFARIDYQVDGGDAWNFHIGSTMCVSDGNTDPPSEECARPNRATIRLDGFDVATDVINIDAAAIVADSDMTSNVMTPGCMTFPHDEVDCVSLFPNLGLDFTSGACVDGCTDQSVFSVAAE